MTLEDLQIATRKIPSRFAARDIEIKTSGDFYGKDSAGHPLFGYACCGMGSCSWSNVPKEHYRPTLFIPASAGPD